MGKPYKRTVLAAAVALGALTLTSVMVALQVPARLRVQRAHARITTGMSLPEVFDKLEQANGPGEWLGMLSGSSCADGRAWALSRGPSGYVVRSHVEATPFGGQGDWRELALANRAAVREFLAPQPSGLCEDYGAGLGRWYFVLDAKDGRVTRIGGVGHEPRD